MEMNASPLSTSTSAPSSKSSPADMTLDMARDIETRTHEHLSDDHGQDLDAAPD